MVKSNITSFNLFEDKARLFLDQDFIQFGEITIDDNEIYSYVTTQVEVGEYEKPYLSLRLPTEDASKSAGTLVFNRTY